MAKAKLAYEAQRSANETAKFFDTVGRGAPVTMGTIGDYSGVTSGVGKNRRYDAEAEEELDRIAKNLDAAANAGKGKGQGQGDGQGDGQGVVDNPVGDDLGKKKKPDKIKGDVDEDDGAAGPDGKTSGPVEVPLDTMEGYTSFRPTGLEMVPGLGRVSKLISDQFNKKSQEELDKKRLEKYGDPNRFNNL